MIRAELLLGDCVERMAAMDAGSVDAVVTDPPYGIRFMGKAWDGAAIEEQARLLHDARRTSEGRRNVRSDTGHEFGGSAYAGAAAAAGDYDFSLSGNRAFQVWSEAWAREALRVLKPGGFLLSFAGTRTYHRMVSGIEDAGFEVRDTLAWMFGSGFPKSRNLGDGRGTALKPAFEPIVVARRPLEGTVFANAERYGTGVLNVDACRIAFAGPDDRESAFPGGATTSHGSGRLAGPGDAQDVDRSEFPAERSETGRWPANVVLSHTPDCVLAGSREVASDGHHPQTRKPSLFGARGHGGLEERYLRGETVEVWECAAECPVRLLDEQSGERRAGATVTGREPSEPFGLVYGEMRRAGFDGYGDAGGASRFFYCAKTSRTERNAGLGAEFEERMLRWSSGDKSPGTFQSEGTDRSARNHHPTVKPIELMRWLVRLVAPAGGVVLDPFLGSGSTGCAAVLEPTVGRFVGIELDPDYLQIAEARVRFWQEHGEDALGVVRVREESDRRRREVEDEGQLDLLA